MTKIRNLLIGIALAASLLSAAEAQDAPTPPNYSVVSGGQVISATTSSAASALASPCPASCAITLYNSGPNPAYYALGGSSVVATTASKPLPPGASIVDWVNASTYVAIITTGGSDTVYAWQGSGPVLAPAPVFAQGGAVSANQGTPNAGGATNSWPVQGAGTAGTPEGGVVSIQGVASGTTIPTTTSPGARTIVALDISTVTTGGTAVTALNAGHRTAGGFLTNPAGATINLCINEQATASGTTSAAGLTCILPGQPYTLAPAAGAVSVITSDSSHPFSGYGLN